MASANQPQPQPHTQTQVKSQSQSYQLPDLLGILSSLELRTNRHCRFATDASESWLLNGGAHSSTSASTTEPNISNGVANGITKAPTSTSSTSGAASSSTDEREAKEGILTPTELKILSSTKLGLLCALCFPTCDAPQLRLLIDLGTLVFFAVLRERVSSFEVSGSDGPMCSTGLLRDKNEGEDTDTQIDPIADVGDLEILPNGFDLLAKHDLLKHIVTPRLLNLSSAATKAWKSRFHLSVSNFSDAHTQLRLKNRVNPVEDNTIPTLEEYTQFLRSLYGVDMVLDLAELLEVFQLPDFQQMKYKKLMEQIKDSAFDMMAWITDVVSYQLFCENRNQYHLIPILMDSNNLSLQGAMNLAGVMIKEAFSTFCTAERELIESLDKHQSTSSRPSVLSLSWMWNALALDPSSRCDQTLDNGHPISSSLADESNAVSENTKRYIQALKDILIGLVHWTYESELFFGKKGGEIRSFGWVFADQMPGVSVVQA